jgi:hypothetical protein
MLVAVTDHAAERFRQRVGSTTGEIDVKPEIVRRVSAALDAGRVDEEPRGTIRVRDQRDRSLTYVCRREGAELIVVTLWEREDGVIPPRVPRRFTDALRRDDERKRED